jgi:hypothetical protein
MRTFKDVLDDGFEEHARALPAGGGFSGDRSRSVLRSIHRRRAARAGAATGVSLLTVAAVSVGAMALRPNHDAAPVGPPSPSVSAGPFEFPTPPAGAPAWCDLSTYPAVNPEALGALRYEGRIYADYSRNVFVYVAPDGSHQTFEPDAVGDASVLPPDGGSAISIYVPPATPSWRFAVLDYSQGAGGGRNLSNGGDPGLLYEWTTSVPDVIPAGVDINNLSQQLAITIGIGGTEFNPYAFPDGAIVEQVFRWTDGHTRVEQLTGDTGPGAELADYAGLASVSVRVRNLPGGEEFEITSTYDPTKTWAAACVAGGSASSSTRPTITPTSTPYLEGPESAVFRCNAPLPKRAEEALTTTATLESGEHRVGYAGLASDFDENGFTFDFGSQGVLVASNYELSRSVVDFEYKQQLPGWGSAWGNIDQTPAPDGSTSGNGVVTFTALAWVDAKGVIVGREVVATDPDGLYLGSGSKEAMGGPEVGGWAKMSYVVANVDTLGVPCDGVDPGALDSASLVWLEGAGPDADHMTWSWTRVSPLSKD